MSDGLSPGTGRRMPFCTFSDYFCERTRRVDQTNPPRSSFLCVFFSFFSFSASFWPRFHRECECTERRGVDRHQRKTLELASQLGERDPSNKNSPYLVENLFTAIRKSNLLRESIVRPVQPHASRPVVEGSRNVDFVCFTGPSSDFERVRAW